jgi:hypothetical protein
MTILDAPSSSAPERAIASPRPRSAIARDRPSGTGAETPPRSPPSDLDSTDRLILTLEQAAPGPHADTAGISPAGYMRRLRRLLYNREANEFAPDTLARLRTELCSARGLGISD